MSDKPKFPAETAKAVVRELLPRLEPACATDAEGKPWLRVAGSLRRRKATVGDIEFVYAPAFGPVKDGLFMKEGNLMDDTLERLVAEGVLAPRVLGNGSLAWGAKNKLALHVASGIPVDFFSTAAAAFWNYLVCRTGSKENNIAIAEAAKRRGLKWSPYEPGFRVADLDLATQSLGRDDLYSGRLLAAQSEEEVYSLAGLPYLPPHQR